MGRGLYSPLRMRRLLLGVLVLGLVLDLGLLALGGLPRVQRAWILRNAPLATRRAAAWNREDRAEELAAFCEALRHPGSARRILLAVGARNAWFAPFGWQDLAPRLLIVQARDRRGHAQLVQAARAAHADALLATERGRGWTLVDLEP